MLTLITDVTFSLCKFVTSVRTSREISLFHAELKTNVSETGFISIIRVNLIGVAYFPAEWYSIYST
jgi:hypothetical protein